MRHLILSPALLCLLSALAFAQVSPPSQFQLQGRLTDNAGQPVTSITRDLRVEFYNSAGLLLGTSTVVDPAITNGVYAVSLTIPAGMCANNDDVFMEMAVGDGAGGPDGTFEVLSPRTRVLASAYALNADTLDGRDSSFFAQASNSFVQNGNAFASLATLGTNDAFDLVLETAGVERMRILGSGASAGNVGIGTTTPSVKLQVVGQTRSSSFSSADGTAGSPAYRFESDTDVGMFLSAPNTLGFTTGGTERVTIGPAGEVSLQGNTLTFTNPLGSGTVSTVANAAMTVTSAGAGTLFLNAGATGATRMQTGGADRLYIENNGRVGIGTTTPSSRLSIGTSGALADGLTFGPAGTAGIYTDPSGWLGLTNEAGVRKLTLFGTYARADENFIVEGMLRGSGGNTPVRADTGFNLLGGNLGVFTGAPDHRLHVAGSMRLDTGFPFRFGAASENTDEINFTRTNPAADRSDLTLTLGDNGWTGGLGVEEHFIISATNVGRLLDLNTNRGLEVANRIKIFSTGDQTTNFVPNSCAGNFAVGGGIIEFLTDPGGG